jgi:hypothetical protein
MILFGCNTPNRATTNSKNERKFISYKDSNIQYEGRIGEKNGAAAELYWPGTIVRFRFKGTVIKAFLQDYNGQNYFTVLIDGNPVDKIKIDSAKRLYSLGENLSDSEHVVELFKSTQINKEYNRGYTWFYGFELNNGKALSPPALKKRKIEFYGNSITCGHAVEDTTGGDSGASIFENNYLSYASLTARHYNAQYSCIAISGIGLMAGFRKNIMPEVYNLRNPFDSTNVWNFSKYVADVVVVNLLQNDEAVIARPENEQFKKRFGAVAPSDESIINAYKNFIGKMRTHYPQASIICVLGNMSITKQGSKWPGLVEQAVKELHDSKVYTHFFKFKETPGHPRAAEQNIMAESLIKFIDAHIYW